MLRAFATSTAPMAARMARAPTRIASSARRHDSPPDASAAPSASASASAHHAAAAAPVASVRTCGARSFHATTATGSHAPGSGSPSGSRSTSGGHSSGHNGGGGGVSSGGRVMQSEWDLRPPSSAASGGGMEHVISIDRSGLLGMHHTEEAEATAAELAAKSKHTPMVDELRSQIKIRGALSMSDYIFQCLQNQQFGYYTANPAASVIGGKEGADAAAHGDFITSPELGQVFGELLGVWVLQVWEQLGKPAKFQLVEFGPGKGTLMQDVLRTVSHFPEFVKGVHVHLMETSPHMRDEQVRSLRVRKVVKQASESKPKMTREQAQQAIKDAINKRAQGETDTTAAAEVVAADAAAALTGASGNAPLSDISKEELLIQSLLDTRDSPDVLMSGEITLPIGVHTSPSNADEAAAIAAAEAEAAAAATAAGLPPSIPITWHSKVSQVPADGGPLIVLAHEFFDALPVYQFVMTERGWCEKMVDEDRGAGPHHFRFVLSAQPTLASRTFLPPDKFPPQDAKIGEAVEICAAGLACMEDLSRRLSVCGGAALVIDYGTNHPNANTLQAVQKHKYKHVLEEPGKVDLTALVDFKSLRATVERTNKLLRTPPLSVLPLVTQSHLLRNLNMAARLERIVQRAIETGSLNEGQVSDLISNAVRLVSPDTAAGGMGRHFKAMCVVSQQLADSEIVPFNIPDELMAQEEAEYAALGKEKQKAAAGGRDGANDSLFGAAQLPYADPPPKATEHLFSAAPVDKPQPKQQPSATEQATANSTTQRRAAAREAAAQLAKARAEREAAAAAAAKAAGAKPN